LGSNGRRFDDGASKFSEDKVREPDLERVAQPSYENFEILPDCEDPVFIKRQSDASNGDSKKAKKNFIDFERGKPDSTAGTVDAENSGIFFSGESRDAIEKSSISGASKMNRSHHPKMIDDDTERFKIRLDDMLNRFRLDTLNEFMDAKRCLLEDQVNSISKEKNNYENILMQKNNEISELKESLGKSLLVLEKKSNSILKMSEIIGKEKILKMKYRTAGKALFALKIYADLSKKLRGRKKMIQKFTTDTLKKKAMNSFRKIYVNRLRTKTEERVSGVMGNQMEDMSMKYQKQIQMLEKSLEQAHQAIDTNEQNKIDLQQNLKNAFLKGLCAMNFEAMNVLGSNNPVMSMDPSQALGS
jgi:hypothetical protein